VIGDGPLYTLPLGMLVERYGEEERRRFAASREAGRPLAEYATLPYLGERYRISYLPSASALAALRESAAARRHYAEQLVLNKAGLTLNGSSGAKLVVPDLAAVNGIEIRADNVTVRGLEIAGPLNGVPYDVYYRVEPGYATPTHISRGIAVMAGFTGFTLRDNNIHDVRNGILIHGSNGTGNVVADNRIDNTKSGISVQYTGGAGIDIAGNREGALGNEWGLNLNLNRYANDSQKQEAPDLAWQQQLLGLSAVNGGWSVQDQGFRSANRKSWSD